MEIGLAVARAQSMGCPVVFLTLTMRHHRGQSLAALWGALTGAWKAVREGSTWRSLGLLGFVRVIEVTHGVNGWHVHVHALLVFHPGAVVDADAVGDRLFVPWSAALVRQGLDAPLRKGADARLIAPDGTGIAEYLAKVDASGLGREMTMTQGKTARGAHKTESMWSILERAVCGDPDAAILWDTWERVSHGHRQIGWSRGLRALLLGSDDEASDDEIAAAEPGTDDDRVATITPDGWPKLVAKPWLIPTVLEVAETRDVGALHALLVLHQIDHDIHLT